MNTNNKTNIKGGTFLVASSMDWAINANPFRAFGDLARQGKVTGKPVNTIISNGKSIKESDNGISVYYITDWKQFGNMRYGTPLDIEGKPLGFPIYTGVGDYSNIERLNDLINGNF